MIRCLIIDDEPAARDIIRTYVEQTPFLKLTGEAESALQAMEFLNNQQTDLIFLDINMPGLSGIQFLRSLSQKPSVILTTAYSEYALEGYELDVVDYLLKPFSFERFLKAVNKIKQEANTDETLTIKSDGKWIRLDTSEIQFIKGMGDYIRIHTTDEKYVVYDTMKSFESSLDSSGFIRIHKSYIIALKHVEYVEGNLVIMADTELPIGKAYKNEFLRRFMGKF